MNWLTAFFNGFRQDRVPTGYAWDDRRWSYALYDAYYDNSVFRRITDGGQRDNINALLGNAAAADLAGLYNPVPRVVDLYGHVFSGAFGTDIRAETTNQPLQDAINQIWRWSNLTIERQEITQLAPLHGLVGLRIGVRNDPDPAQRRIWIKPEHPRVILDVQRDERGNLDEVLLEYDLELGTGEDKEVLVIREKQTKDRIQTWRNEKGQLTPYDLTTNTPHGPYSDYPNELGVVSYVLLHHSTRNRPWSLNAFYKAVDPINALNALLSHIDVQIHRHVNARWLVAAAGKPPEEFDLSGMKVIYVNTGLTGGAPVMQAMVANLSLADAIARATQQLGLIEDMLPELKATGGRFLSGQSGETIKELRQPAEDMLALARTNHEDALVRATQIAVSWGVLLDLWDVGTGQGSRTAADAAYRQGAEDFTFNKRPLLPDSPLLLRQIAKAEQELGVSQETTLAAIGHDPAQERRRRQAEQPTTPAPMIPTAAPSDSPAAD